MRFVKPSEIIKAKEEVQIRILGTEDAPSYQWTEEEKPERPYYGVNSGQHVVCLSLTGKCPFCDHFKKETQ